MGTTTVYKKDINGKIYKYIPCDGKWEGIRKAESWRVSTIAQEISEKEAFIEIL